VDAFLDYLFVNLAIKTQRLTLRETAGVARYLMALAFEMPEGSERKLVTRVAENLWLGLVSVGKIRRAEKQQAIDFLMTHSKTYFKSLDIKRLVQLVGDHGEPRNNDQAFRPAGLTGANRSVQNPGRLEDDLTERIYVAYHALRRAGVPNARGQIASALNRFGIETRARSKTDRAWGSAEVHERVRQFEQLQTRRARTLRRDSKLDDIGWARKVAQQVELWRDQLVNNWVADFRREICWRQMVKPQPATPST